MTEKQFPIGAAVVGQSGGPTAAINATLAGVIRACLSSEARGKITSLYGMKNGIEGFLEDRLVDLFPRFLTSEGVTDEEKLYRLERTPAAALGSCRVKLPPYDPDEKIYVRIAEALRKHDIRYFFYIGGNDSMDTVEKLRRFTEETGYDLRVIGLPKTIDNDLLGTDHTPGYGSAAKYVATVMQEIVCDTAVYTVPAVTIVEIMGRNAGWLTAAAALPRLVGGAAPDLVYLPEATFDMDRFFEDVRETFRRKSNVVVAVSEGIRFADGEYVGAEAQSGVTDVFRHKYLAGAAKVLERRVRTEFGCKVRSLELSLPQRCSSHCASLTDLTEAEEVGAAGVAAALSGTTGCMMALERIDSRSESYAVRYVPKDVRTIANGERLVPASYINERGNGVTDECLRYLLPLIRGEVSAEGAYGLPWCVVLD